MQVLYEMQVLYVVIAIVAAVLLFYFLQRRADKRQDEKNQEARVLDILPKGQVTVDDFKWGWHTEQSGSVFGMSDSDMDDDDTSFYVRATKKAYERLLEVSAESYILGTDTLYSHPDTSSAVVVVCNRTALSPRDQLPSLKLTNGMYVADRTYVQRFTPPWIVVPYFYKSQRTEKMFNQLVDGIYNGMEHWRVWENDEGYFYFTLNEGDVHPIMPPPKDGVPPKGVPIVANDSFVHEIK